MDTIDRRILTLLQGNARMAASDISRKLELVPSAIHQRIKKLEESGVIRGYSACLDPLALDQALVAFVHLRTDERLGDPSVAEAVAGLPEVLEVHDIAGEDCYLLKVRVADTAALHALLRERIAQIKSVRSTRTTIVMKTFKETGELPITIA
jgi:Lrp/AsnC family leucine-responsive transcriptional regulator